MPNFYEHDDDGRLHTRYSDLVRCTNKSVVNVCRELIFGKSRFVSDVTDFGKVRHEMFERESLQTGKTPKVFLDELGFSLDIDLIEKQLSCVVFPDVVLHSTIDAGSTKDGVIVDYKTSSIKEITCDKEKDLQLAKKNFENTYKRSKQHLAYGLQMVAKGIIPKKAVYLGEIWSKDREKLVGYHKVEIDLNINDIVEFKNVWLKDRCERLVVAMEYFKNFL